MTAKRIKQLKDLMIRARANASESLADMLDALQALKIQGDQCEKAKALNERRSVVEVIVNAHGRIEKIDAALARLKNGTYGACLECGGTIREARLLVQPWAEHCILCQESREAAMLGHLPNDYRTIAGRPAETAWSA